MEILINDAVNEKYKKILEEGNISEIILQKKVTKTKKILFKLLKKNLKKLEKNPQIMSR